MAKKYKPTYSAQNGKNRHHILWIRRSWAKGFWSNKLRNHPAMIVLVDADAHARLHELVEPIPVPSESACKDTYEQIKYLWGHGVLNENSSLDIRIDVLIYCLAYVADPTVEALLHQKEIASKLGIL